MQTGCRRSHGHTMGQRHYLCRQYDGIFVFGTVCRKSPLTSSLRTSSFGNGHTTNKYSASSAYRAFFTGQCGIPRAKELSKTRATPRCKFFFWLVLLGRCWTSERLQRHNLQNSGPCALCSQQPEAIQQLLLSCAYSRETVTGHRFAPPNTVTG